MRKTLLGFVFFLSIFTIGLAPKPAHALTLTPTRLEVSGDPGTTITTKMTVINDQPVAGTYYSSFANFEAQGDSGTPALTAATDDLGTWISVPPSIGLTAGGSQDIPIIITIPKTASPGGHFAAIFWGTQPLKNTDASIGITAKTGILVLLRVNGDISEAGGVTEFDTVTHGHYFNALPIPFYYRFQNGGGDRIEPTGNIVMKDMIFITASKVPGNPVQGNILPQSTRKFLTSWVGKAGEAGVMPKGFFAAANYELHNFALGRYAAHLKLAYGTKGEVTDKVVHVFVWPWQLLLFILIVALAIYILIKTAIHHYNKWIIGKAEEMLEAKEKREEKAAAVAAPAVQVPAAPVAMPSAPVEHHDNASTTN